MQSQREQAVRRIANDVLVDTGAVGRPRIDPFEIARARDLTVESRAGFPPSVYGVLYLDGSRFGVILSEDCHGDGHRNFTLAHELGHYHIPGHMDGFLESGGGQMPSLGGHFRDRKDPHEREADWFASELLLPTVLVESVALSLAPDVRSIRSLAEDRQVSLCCAGIRYAELTDHPVAVIVSRNGEIEWVAFSDRMAEHRWSRRVWKKEWVPRDTATRALASSQTRVERGEEDESSCLLCEWFEGAPPMVTADEQAVGLGTYGRVLTLLSAPRLPSVEELEEEEQSGGWREKDWRTPLRGYELD